MQVFFKKKWLSLKKGLNYYMEPFIGVIFLFTSCLSIIFVLSFIKLLISYVFPFLITLLAAFSRLFFNRFPLNICHVIHGRNRYLDSSTQCLFKIILFKTIYPIMPVRFLPGKYWCVKANSRLTKNCALSCDFKALKYCFSSFVTLRSPEKAETKSRSNNIMWLINTIKLYKRF